MQSKEIKKKPPLTGMEFKLHFFYKIYVQKKIEKKCNNIWIMRN